MLSHQAVPGLRSRGNRQQPAGLQDGPGRGVMRLGQAKGRAGQGHRHRSGTRQGGDILRRGLHQVVGRDRAQFGCQAGPAQVVKFIGMDFERETQRLARLSECAASAPG